MFDAIENVAKANFGWVNSVTDGQNTNRDVYVWVPKAQTQPLIFSFG
jgi:hypothetical protein